ncbi:hypothetical protein PR048_006875, partial [Dryococelus australis]
MTIVTVQKEAIFEVNNVPKMKANADRSVSYHADSLIEDIDINYVELYNSHIANAVRCQSAVIAYNKKDELHRVIHKTFNNKSPYKKFTKLKKGCAKKDNARNFPRADEDYGPDAAVPDMPLDQLEVAKEEYVQKLTKEKRNDIECRTRGQSSTQEWKEEKRKRLTASNFASTSCSSLVQSVRYPTFVGATEMKWGLEHEHVALNELSKHLHMPFRRSGLIFHPEHPFLGALPDALFDEDAIAEIKCPYSIKDMSPQEAYKRKMVFLNKKAHITTCYQVQGQLNISQKRLCNFVVWYPKGDQIPNSGSKKWFQNLSNFTGNAYYRKFWIPGRHEGMQFVILSQSKMPRRKWLNEGSCP